MKNKNKIKLNLNQAVILSVILIVLSFMCGYLWAKNKGQTTTKTGTSAEKTKIEIP